MNKFKGTDDDTTPPGLGLTSEQAFFLSTAQVKHSTLVITFCQVISFFWLPNMIVNNLLPGNIILLAPKYDW